MVGMLVLLVCPFGPGSLPMNDVIFSFTSGITDLPLCNNDATVTAFFATNFVSVNEALKKKVLVPASSRFRKISSHRFSDGPTC